MNKFWILGILAALSFGCTSREMVQVVTTTAEPANLTDGKRTILTHSGTRIAEELKRNGIKCGVVGSFQATFSVPKQDEERARKIITELIKKEGLYARIEIEQAAR